MAEEIEKLRAELKKGKDEAPPSPVKQPLSEAETAAVNKIEQQARKEDEEAYCTFEVLDKHQLMDLPEGALLPKYQDIKRDHPTMLVPFKISFAEACAGVHVDDTLTVSHRWQLAHEPDQLLYPPRPAHLRRRRLVRREGDSQGRVRPQAAAAIGSHRGRGPLRAASLCEGEARGRARLGVTVDRGSGSGTCCP